MKHYAINILPNAGQEIEDAYLYIKNNSAINALHWYKEIYENIQSLSSYPLRRPLAPENAFFKEEIRQLTAMNYRILFTVTEETVNILHVRHNRQLWLKGTTIHT